MGKGFSENVCFFVLNRIIGLQDGHDLFVSIQPYLRISIGVK